MKLKNFGLVLGGGVARGIIHVGVRKYLQEKGIIPKEIIGTSAGGVIGAMAATGKTRQEMRDIIILFNKKKRSLMDVRMANGLIKGQKILDFLKEIFGDLEIQDCMLPFKTTAVDIESGEIKIFEQGNIAEAVRATIGVPTIFSPFKIGENFYVDGGLLTNLPIEHTTTKKILAVSVIQEEYKVKVVSNFGINLSLLHRTIELLVKQNEAKSLLSKNKNITLFNRHHRFAAMDFQRYDEMIDFGYTEMQRLFGE